eukprot:CAMPEP_0196772898 /NCGR_PEP_ID=MMETSP1104-20130614/2481_1 /TAXON_ID=33652 /ORGANISM="Cafeteria sp., Strain Caron Lab Isolate" /LENGTH=119 /DNA_ID=CAMNT_0042143041 /DNA_START=9 /DNA_END=363 /DNA_ORIENTATION=+
MIRVKRKNQTVFLRVGPTTTFASIKDTVGKINEVDPKKIKLFGPDKEHVLENDATIGDQQIQDNAIVYMVYAADDSGVLGIDRGVSMNCSPAQPSLRCLPSCVVFPTSHTVTCGSEQGA